MSNDNKNAPDGDKQAPVAKTLIYSCPHCGMKFFLKADTPNLGSRSVRCSSCGNISRVADCKRIDAPSGYDPTMYGKDIQKGEPAIGRLLVSPSGEWLELKTGTNLIGRRSPTSKAALQIPGSEANRQISREHIVIEVREYPGHRYLHVAKLFKREVNATYVDDKRLEFNQEVELKSGCVIRLPGIDLKFYPNVNAAK